MHNLRILTSFPETKKVLKKAISANRALAKLSGMAKIIPNLKKSTKTISLRLPANMLEELKVKANALDIPYQSFIKVLLKKELSSM